MALFSTDKKPPTIAARDFPAPELIDDEANAIGRLIDNEGWKALRRVWNAKLSYVGRQLVNAGDDHRFYQGMYQGMEMAMHTPDDLVTMASNDSAAHEPDLEADFRKQQLAMADRTTGGYE